MGLASLDFELGYLNKWEMYKALQGEDYGPCKVPRTAILDNRSFLQMMKLYRAVYVKQVDTWGGQNISVARKSGNIFLWKKQGQSDSVYQDVKSLSDELVDYYTGKLSIVQQSAPLITIQGRPFTIRVHMQRQVNNEWKLAGSLARIGGANSLVSNVGISNGTVVPVATVLSSFSKNKRRQIQRSFEQIGHRICRLVDKYREFDEVGLDLGVDSKGRLWLIEVNTDNAIGIPDHDLFAQLPDRSLYEEMISVYKNRKIERVKCLLSAFFEFEDLAN